MCTPRVDNISQTVSSFTPLRCYLFIFFPIPLPAVTITNKIVFTSTSKVRSSFRMGAKHTFPWRWWYWNINSSADIGHGQNKKRIQKGKNVGQYITGVSRLIDRPSDNNLGPDKYISTDISRRNHHSYTARRLDDDFGHPAGPVSRRRVTVYSSPANNGLYIELRCFSVYIPARDRGIIYTVELN